VPAPRPRRVSPKRARSRVSAGKAKSPERVFAAELGRGTLPSLRSVMHGMSIGAPRAREVLADLRTALDARTPERVTVDA
jgi:hypothetical protein